MSANESLLEPLPSGERRPGLLSTVLLPLSTLAALVLLWHVLVIASGSEIFLSPMEVLRGLVELARKGVLASYIGDSLWRVGCGYLIALALGIPLGLVLGWYPAAAAALNPVIQVLRPISALAWIPIAIVLFGVTNLAAIFLIFLASFFPIVVATMNGVRNVPMMYLSAGRNFGLSVPALFARVILPAALPRVLTGLRVALGVAWLVVVAAEMLAVDSGLGYLVIDSRNAGKRYDLVVAAMLLIGLIGLGLNSLVRLIERMRAVRWGFLGS
ncbi:MAG TPA: ABC transporter permease [Thermoanaerobaculia bacterium]|nr:ABC transporter permease [Thermoanaerobaculia bacterium]